MNTKMLLDEARGLRDLGLYAEAEVALRKVEANDPAARDEAQKRLVLLFAGLGRFQEAADLGLGLIARGVFDYGAIVHTMLALNYLDRIEEGRDTLLLIEKCGHKVEEEAYQLACFEARLGNFGDALGWLMSEFRRSREYYARSFEDSDLGLFWTWFRAYRPTLRLAHLLIETPFKDVCAAALDEKAPMELSPADLAMLPEGQRRLFRFDFNAGAFVLNAIAVASDPQAAADLERERKARIESVFECVERGHKHAADVVLDAQVLYAAEHAAWGNHLGARFHILWALPLRPTLLLDFFNDPRLNLMTPFLTEIIGAKRHDKTFVKRMRELSECKPSDGDRMWQLLEETPACLRESGLYQLNLGLLHHAEEEYDRALPLWAKLREMWPQDAAGFGNAVYALQKLGREDEAKELLAKAPTCYRRFRLYWAQMAELHSRPNLFPPVPVGRFRGRPDLGGLLIPETDSKRDFGFVADADQSDFDTL